MSERKKITFDELRNYFIVHNKTHDYWKDKIEAVIVFTEDSFDREYSEESRSYKVNSDNKTFRDCCSNSLYGSCLDGTDQFVRLDHYMNWYGRENGWKVEYCYLLA